MEGLIPLVYRAIVEYRKARHQVAFGSRLLYGDHHQPCGSSALFCVVDHAGSSSSSWHAAPSSMSPATSPAAARANSSLASPLLRSASRRQFAGVKQVSRGQAFSQKPADHLNHLKPLHVKAYIDGKLANMLVDIGASNLMPYSLYKRLGGSDEELIKTKRMVKGVGGNSILAKGFAVMKLIGSKTLATIFFVEEVQGSYFDSWVRMDS